ncbi:MAG TPA: hypothetical protein VG167_15855 [Verrucomicrobiae bacterium]|nr:hypothetical protein [Verrucomicrobiae bacterium]
MVGKFKVIDTTKQAWPARDGRPEQINHLLILLDEGECPMRQMPRYVLDADAGEVEKFSGGQLNGKSVQIEVREMSGKGNPTMRGRLIVNGSTPK